MFLYRLLCFKVVQNLSFLRYFRYNILLPLKCQFWRVYRSVKKRRNGMLLKVPVQDEIVILNGHFFSNLLFSIFSNLRFLSFCFSNPHGSVSLGEKTRPIWSVFSGDLWLVSYCRVKFGVRGHLGQF